MFNKILCISFVILNFVNFAHAMNEEEYRKFLCMTPQPSIKFTEYLKYIEDLKELNIPVVAMEFPIKEFKDQTDNSEFFQKWKDERTEFIKRLSGPNIKGMMPFNYVNVRLGKIRCFEIEYYTAFNRKYSKDIEAKTKENLIEFEKIYTSFPKLEDE